MLTILNRKELLITMDMKRQADVRNVLSKNGIEYSVKTTNLQSAGSRVRTGNPGMNIDCSYEYKIYVSKEDYSKALYLIQAEKNK